MQTGRKSLQEQQQHVVLLMPLYMVARCLDLEAVGNLPGRINLGLGRMTKKWLVGDQSNDFTNDTLKGRELEHTVNLTVYVNVNVHQNDPEPVC